MNFGILAPIIAFLGLAAGSIISSFAKEELEPGKKYLGLLRKIILSLIIALGLFCAFLYSGIIMIIFSAAAIFPAIKIRKSIKAEYAYLGLLGASILLVPGVLQMTFFSLLFIYGILNNNSKKELKENALLFFLPFVILFFADIQLMAQIFSFASASLIFFIRKQ